MSYVEKEDVIAIINEIPRAWNKHCGISKMEYLKIRISNITDTDVASVRHGRWIGIDGEWHDWKCSECGSERDGRTPYCPNCGSRMDGRK